MLAEHAVLRNGRESKILFLIVTVCACRLSLLASVNDNLFSFIALRYG